MSGGRLFLVYVAEFVADCGVTTGEFNKFFESTRVVSSSAYADLEFPKVTPP